VDARKGRDIQGIPWEQINITRKKYRQSRLEQYKNYENVPNSGEEAMKVCLLLYLEVWLVKFSIRMWLTLVLE
jgi:hypothetical protein